MQTALTKLVKDQPHGQEADAILRKCVHCGFCAATCPTYQLLGDELDGPRGRIYLIKQALEGQPVSAKTQLHLDRCLTCRSCETTCPSGVQYSRLLDIGRQVVDARVRRSLGARFTRRALGAVLPYPMRFATLLGIGRFLRPLLPPALKHMVPPRQPIGTWPIARHARRMLVLDGCVQPALAANINAATARVLDRLGVSLISANGSDCCGAVSHHMAAQQEGLSFVRRNIDVWWPHIEQGIEAIVMTASGCGAFVREYAHLLRFDKDYAHKAERVSQLTKDISEVIQGEELAKRSFKTCSYRKVAFHSPCTLQHGQGITGLVESSLGAAGFKLTAVPDGHLCCGSAGTYAILQRVLSQKLLQNKLVALQSQGPDVIATANIGCLVHLATEASVPVRHWVELLDEVMN